jgi:moderate conductance mechanosensitive channel
VIGVAVGFGAQTLVKDVLSGFFYLLDDAFRVGEYIQSGTYKGTVESFTLRSVKLRHHRGPVYTVPFGSLGAIENLSRDWVLEKIVIAVTFDTDLRKVKKLIKQIGSELLEDPEFALHIIETVKMQGVEEFGDYGIRLRLKLIRRPGEQFPIRRRAYCSISTVSNLPSRRSRLPKARRLSRLQQSPICGLYQPRRAINCANQINR